jgi:hypothetical protein
MQMVKMERMHFIDHTCISSFINFVVHFLMAPYISRHIMWCDSSITKSSKKDSSISRVANVDTIKMATSWNFSSRGAIFKILN